MPGSGEPFFAGGHIVFGGGRGLLHHAPYPGLVLLDVLFSERSARDKEFSVLREGSRLFLDRLIHAGLGKARLIGFIMSVTAVAHDINDDVLLIFSPVIGCQLADEVDRLNVVAVDVENRGVN